MSDRDPDKPIVTTLCGSTRFGEAQRLAQAHLTMMGRIIIPCGFYGHVDDPEGFKFLCDDGDEAKPAKQLVDQLHFRKIDISDGIYIVNVGGYVGSSTRREIRYARNRDKTIEWMFEDAIPGEFRDDAERSSMEAVRELPRMSKGSAT